MSALQLLPNHEMPSGMTVAELINAKRELLQLMEQKHRDIVEHRLRYYAPYPKQIEFHAAGLTFRERLLMAANQSGKTWSAGAEVAMHLTGQYPTGWPGRYMRAANRWMAGSESAELTKKGLQRILLGNPEVESEWGTGMIPKDCILDVSRRAGVADAVASIVVKHSCGDPSTLQLNSYDQGRSKWQADTVDGCIAAGQLVPLADGRCIPIEQVEVGQFVLTTDKRGRRVARRVAAVHDQGLQETVEVETSRGPWIVATPDHEVYTTVRDKERIDQAARVLTLPSTWEPDYCAVNLPDAFYAWAGLVIAEGSTSCRKITMADCPAVRHAIALLPPGAAVRQKDFAAKHSHVPDWFLDWPDFWALMPQGAAHEKTIPDWVFMSPNSRIATLLGHLYAGDGWAAGHLLGYATTSRRLAEQVSMLLWRLGVRSSISLRPARGEWREQWWVMVSASDSVLRFAAAISIPGKETALAAVVQEASRRCGGKVDRSPALKGDRFGSKEERARYFADQNSRNRERFATLQAVRPAGLRRVYDLSIEEDHRFAVGTSIVSNCWFDEEPPLELYTEGLTRTNTTQGPVMMTFTPLLGQSAVVLRFRRERPAGTHVTNMTIDDALHYSAEDRAAIIASYPEHEREARTRGIPIMGSGRVFPIAEAGIAIEPFHLPAHWPRIVGLDFGWDHPAAAVWMAWDRDTDTVYIYDVWRAREQSVAMQALVLRARGDWIPVAWPHDGLQHDKGSGEQLAKQYKTAGVAMLRERAQFEDGTNGVEAGIQDMLKRMQTRQLRVFKHLEDWFEEFRDYHRKDGLIVKERDDLMAASRYGLMELRHALTEYEARGSMAQALGVFGQATAFGVLDPSMGY